MASNALSQAAIQFLSKPTQQQRDNSIDPIFAQLIPIQQQLEANGNDNHLKSDETKAKPDDSFSVSAFLDAFLAEDLTSTNSSNVDSLLTQLHFHRENISKSRAKLNDSTLTNYKTQLQRAQDCDRELSQFHTESSLLSAEFHGNCSEFRPAQQQLATIMQQYAYIERISLYLNTAKRVEDISALCNAQITENKPREAATNLLSLCRIYRQVRSPARSGQILRVTYLERVIRRRIRLFSASLRPKLLELYDSGLEAISWPQTVNSQLNLSNKAALENVLNLTEALVSLQFTLQHVNLEQLQYKLKLKTINFEQFQAEKSLILAEKLWILHNLLLPIEKRFLFHFSGSKETARLDKPEWFLTFLHNIIVENRDFLVNNMQNVINQCGAMNSAAETVPNISDEFVFAILHLITAKITAISPKLYEDPVLFRHYVDELINFDSKLRSEAHYSAENTACLDRIVAESPDFFEFWLKTDKDWVNDRLESLRFIQNPWNSAVENENNPDLNAFLAENSDSDEENQVSADKSLNFTDISAVKLENSTNPSENLRFTRSSTALIALIDLITARFALLSVVSHRLRFVFDLQFKLLEIYGEDMDIDGEKLLEQLENVVKGNEIGGIHGNAAVLQYCGLCNTVESVEFMLNQWNMDRFFLELALFQQNPLIFGAETTISLLKEHFSAGTQLEIGNSGLFDPVISVFSQQKLNFLENLVNLCMKSFKTNTKRWRHQGFQQHFSAESVESPQNEESLAEPTESFSLALFQFKSQLSAINYYLSPSLFTNFYEKITYRIGSFVLEEVILASFFSPEGLQQLNRDLSALFSYLQLFSAQNQHETAFVAAKEALALLNSNEKQRKAVETALNAGKLSGVQAEKQLLHEISSEIGVNLTKLSPAQLKSLVEKLKPAGMKPVGASALGLEGWEDFVAAEPAENSDSEAEKALENTKIKQRNAEKVQLARAVDVVGETGQEIRKEIEENKATGSNGANEGQGWNDDLKLVGEAGNDENPAEETTEESEKEGEREGWRDDLADLMPSAAADEQLDFT
jgi:hypothetical protein